MAKSTITVTWSHAENRLLLANALAHMLPGSVSDHGTPDERVRGSFDMPRAVFEELHLWAAEECPESVEHIPDLLDALPRHPSLLSRITAEG